MTVRIFYFTRGGEIDPRYVLVRHVESLRLVKLTEVETKTFGNTPVLYRNVARIEAEYPASGIARG